jgi:thiol-disulfide isomerase/thioredoxin
MGGVRVAEAAGPALPPIVEEAFRRAGEARSGGNLAGAVAALESALGQLRTEPLGTPFMARVLLGMVLADTYLDAGQRELARRLLLDESGHAEQIVQSIRLNGLPEQLRAAEAGRLQIRDRAAQVDLLDREAPEIEVADWMLGEATSLAALRGKVVLLEFWATWCRPCLELMPSLGLLHQQYAERGLEIVALTRYEQAPSDADPAEARARERDLVRTVIAGRGLAFRVGIAPDARVQQRYGATGVPTLALIDRAGRVRLCGSGGDEAALEAAIVDCLDE